MLNSDAIRFSMWGSQESIWAAHADKYARVAANKLTFGALDYAAGQVMAAGYNVIYDCNANRFEERNKMALIAKNNGGHAMVVYIKTPHELAIERITHRQNAQDALQKNPERARELVERFAKNIEVPRATETVVEISGEVPFDQQYELFKSALNRFGE
jgi:predicted kinase